MNSTITVTANCTAAFAHQLVDLPHQTRALVRAVDSDGNEWAVVDIAPMTDATRAIFPCDEDGYRGDTSKRGTSGVIVFPGRAFPTVVIDRAARMYLTCKGK